MFHCLYWSICGVYSGTERTILVPPPTPSLVVMLTDLDPPTSFLAQMLISAPSTGRKALPVPADATDEATAFLLRTRAEWASPISRTSLEPSPDRRTVIREALTVKTVLQKPHRALVLPPRQLYAKVCEEVGLSSLDLPSAPWPLPLAAGAPPENFFVGVSGKEIFTSPQTAFSTLCTSIAYSTPNVDVLVSLRTRAVELLSGGAFSDTLDEQALVDVFSVVCHVVDDEVLKIQRSVGGQEMVRKKSQVE